MQSRRAPRAEPTNLPRRRARLARLSVALCLVALGHGRAALAQEQRQGDAKAHFERGLALADAGRFEDASVEFESAYDLSPRPAVLYNIGMAQAAARRPSLALQALSRYLQLSGPELDQHRKDDVVAQIETLRAQLATLDVSSVPMTGEIHIDGRAVQDPHAVSVDPGSHIVVGSAPGYADASRSIAVRSGESLRVDLVLQVVPQPSSASAAVTQPVLSPPQRSVAPGAEPRFDVQLARDRAHATSQRVWLAASTALGGALLAGATTALIVDNQARYSRWTQEQATLDKQWLNAGPGAGPKQGQTENDQRANRIKLQDEVSVGLGVASGACLIVAAVVWFAGGERPESSPRTALMPRGNGAELSFTW
jgi:tetratricopeptide (TPR) repeat protein